MGKGDAVGGLLWAVMPKEGALLDRFYAHALRDRSGRPRKRALWSQLFPHPGIAVSTTQTFTGAMMRFGALRRPPAARRGVAKDVAIARIVSPPATTLTMAGSTSSDFG